VLSMLILVCSTYAHIVLYMSACGHVICVQMEYNFYSLKYLSGKLQKKKKFVATNSTTVKTM
jgi:hypothetical protein